MKACLSRNFRRSAAVALFAAVGVGSSAQAAILLSGGGLVLAEQGGTFAPGNLAGVSAGAVPFSSSDLGPELPVSFHVAANLNDEIYGNSNSWIGGNANPYPRPFAGVSLDGSYSLQSIAFGRDNLGVFGDRNLGLYELQYTTAPFPDATTPDASWTTIGTLDYQSPGGANFSNPALRHRFNFSQVDNVTGVRLLVPSTGLASGTDIDELELYADAGVVVPPPPNRILAPAPGFGIGVVGQSGPYDPSSPAPVSDNLALATRGAIPIGSSALGVQYGFPFPLHYVEAINDGQYGNSRSWIGADNDVSPFVGVLFDGPVAMERVAWGRDNGDDAGDCCGGRLTDRNLGLYALQFTRLAGATAATPFTGDPATGWATLATVDYLFTAPEAGFESQLRNEYLVQEDGNPVVATGFRIVPPGSGIGPQGTAIDEIEVYGRQVPEPSAFVLAALALAGLAAARRRRG